MSINLNGVDVDSTDISNVHLDLKRNITVTLKDKSEILIKRNERWKETYNELTGYNTDD